MKQKKILLSLFILMLAFNCFAQDFIIGVKYGIGNNNYLRISDKEKVTDYNVQSVGLSLEFSPFYSRFFIISGANYEMTGMGNNVTIPLEFRVALAEKFRPFFQVGGYYSINLEDESEEYTLNNHYGLRAGAGVLWQINKKLRLEGAYIYSQSFVSTFDEEVVLPLNQIITEEYKLRSGKFEFAFKFRF